MQQSLLLVVTLFISGLFSSLSEPWDGSAELNANVTLRWNRHKHSITFRVESTCHSWSGIGFNPGPGDGPMTNADMVILSKVGAELKIGDYWGAGYEMPYIDETDNLVDTSFGLKDNIFWYEFTRPWDTKDNMDNPIYKRGENTILWAFGPDNEYALSYHNGFRGHVTLVLEEDGPQAVNGEDGEEEHHHHHDTDSTEYYQFKFLHQDPRKKEHKHDESLDDSHTEDRPHHH